MSKIICDVCGTSYPETATQCPICGCVRPVDTVTVDTQSNQEEKPTTSTYTYVKGGRFSKANVKKRNSGNYPAKGNEPSDDAQSPNSDGKSSKGLAVLVCVLLLAIIAVVIYIVMSIFAPNLLGGNPAETTTANTTETTVETTEATIPCEYVLISNTEITLEKVDAAFLLNVSLDPKETTDEVFFESADTSIATVDENGKVVAVAPGTTVITVTCGNATAECRVQCDFEIIPEDTTVPETEPTYSTDDFKLNREDFTMTKKSETWLLYKGEIPVKQIVWTSDNEKVVTIQDGVVTAVGTGYTTVYGEYNGVKVSCVVRCAASVGKYVETTSEQQTATAGAYTITPTDVTLNLGKDNTFELKLLDAENNAVDVIWAVGDASICSVSGNTVTGLKAGNTTVSATYEGETYSCIVRVKG